jgi:type I restriction enzyme M protein
LKVSLDELFEITALAANRLHREIKNAYNSTYVEQEDTREKVDIIVLNAQIETIVVREQILRDEIAKIVAEIEVQ